MKRSMKTVIVFSLTLATVLGGSTATWAAPAEVITSETDVESTFLAIEENDFPFTDVTEEDWFYPAVKALYGNQIMLGGDNLFGPYQEMARAQFALILYRLEDAPVFETEKTFNDVSGDEWYGKAVLWAAENGIVTGYENGSFGPADEITREQMAVMLYRYAKFKGYDYSGTADFSGFEDAEDMQAFSADGMNWAVANGIISGKDLNGDQTPETLHPQGTTSRAEVAVMLNRFLEKYTEETEA